MILSALTPIRAASPAPIQFIIEVHSGFPGDQPYIPEQFRSDTTRDAVVADIANAQHEHVKRVLAIDIAAGNCWDATKEIAEDVLAYRLSERGDVPSWLYDFLCEHLGPARVNVAEREWTEAA